MKGGFFKGRLQWWRSPKGSAGFTIVESMIVLAVTGILFVAIATTINGRQHSTEFTTAANAIRSQIQQVINEVSSGYFPSNGDFSCSNTNGVPPRVELTTENTHNAQGENSDCIFLGKLMRFGIKDNGNQDYITYTIAGLRVTPTGATTAQALMSVSPTLIAHSTDVSLVQAQFQPDTSETSTLQYGLSANRMQVVNNDGSKTNIVGIAFVMEPGAAAGSSVTDGSQAIDLIPIAPTSPSSIADSNNTPDKGVKEINDYLQDNITTVNPEKGVEICFASGGTNQSALITIGGSNNVSVEMTILEGTSC